MAMFMKPGGSKVVTKGSGTSARGKKKKEDEKPNKTAAQKSGSQKKDEPISLGVRTRTGTIGRNLEQKKTLQKEVSSVVKRNTGGYLDALGTVAKRASGDNKKANEFADKIESTAAKLQEQGQKENEQAKKMAQTTSKAHQERVKKEGIGAMGIGDLITSKKAKEKVFDVGDQALQMGMDIAVTGGRGTLAAMGARAFGAEKREALNDGATRDQAELSAAGNAAVEVLTEKMFGANKLLKSVMGKGAADEVTDMMVRKFVGKLSGKGAKNFTELVLSNGMGAVEEGLEELVAEGLQPRIANLVYANGISQERIQNANQILDLAVQNGANSSTADRLRDKMDKGESVESVMDTLDTLVANGMNPNDAQKLIEMYAESQDVIRKPDYANAFGMGVALGALGGVAGGAAEYGSARVAEQSVKDMYGENGQREIISKAMQSDDAKTATEAAALNEELNRTGNVSSLALDRMFAAVQQQRAVDEQRTQSARVTAENEVMKQGYSPIVRQNPNTGEIINSPVVDEARADAESKVNQVIAESAMPVKAGEAKAISRAIGNYAAGMVGVEDAEAFTFEHTEARAIFERMTGQELPVVMDKRGNVDVAATNAQTKDAIYGGSTSNYVDLAKQETQLQVEGVKAQATGVMYRQMGAKGQKAYDELSDQIELDNVREDSMRTFFKDSGLFLDFYSAGRNGNMTFEAVRDTLNLGNLTGASEDVFRAAYEAGAEDKKTAATETKAKGDAIRRAAKENASGARFGAQRGQLIIDIDSAERGTTISASHYRMFRLLAESLNINIHLVSGDKLGGANGQYMSEGELYLNASKFDTDRAMEYIFAHELTHHIKVYAPEEYRKLENLVRSRWKSRDLKVAKDGKAEDGLSSMESAIHNKQMQYKNAVGQELSAEDALEEIIADSTYEMLNDADFAQMVAEREPSLGQAMVNAIKQMLANIRDVLARGLGFAPKQNEALLSQLDILKEAEMLWLDAVSAAKMNSAAVGNMSAKGKYSLPESEIHERDEHIRVLEQDAEESYGEPYTEDFNETGYILSNAKLLKMGDYGERMEDHNTILQLYDDISYATSQSPKADAMSRFLNEGHIRIMPEANSLEFGTRVEPTYQQYDQIWAYADDYGVDTIEFTDPSGKTVAYREYDSNPGGRRLYDDIKAFYRNGSLPTARFSVKETEQLDAMGIAVTESGSLVRYSLNSWEDTDVKALEKMLVEAGYEESEVKKWIKNVNSVAAKILQDPERLNYTADEDQKALKDNDEYYYTLDLSTLCAKRRMYQGTYNAVMHRLPNKPMMPEDTIRLRRMMADMGYEVPCGICYEESRKKNEGKFAERWQQKYREENPDAYIPNLDEVTTTDGRERLKKEHPEALESYLKYQRTRGSANPKVSFTHTDYRGDILRMTKGDIAKVKHIGGLRIQSFSDFEIPHVIDMMQAVMDMASMKLTSQAYTKVPAFANIFGGTGIKINLSLIGKVNAKGKLEFDAVEGIDPKEAFKLRKKYSENVGTIIVGADDASILAAWADPRIDMVIPFHRSGWAISEFKALGLGDYQDYQNYQSERYLDGSPDGMALGKAKKAGLIDNDEMFYSIDYWDYSKTGKENAEKYLQLCAENNRRPVFYNFLEDNGDGTWSLKADGSTDGYWKSLVDFKMYNNDGVGAPQQEVKPVFDMRAANKVLAEYEGGADTLPVAQDVVDKFVAEAGTKYSVGDSARSHTEKAIEDELLQRYSEYKNDKENLSYATEAILELKRTEQSDMGRAAEAVEKGEVRYSLWGDSSGIQTIGKAFSEQFLNTSRLDFRGQKINSPNDLASLFQVYRDYRFETFRIVYLKEGKIVSTEGVTSRLPSLSAIRRKNETFASGFRRIANKIERLGADGVYIVHNHPSGDHTPSFSDQSVTSTFCNEIEKSTSAKFLGHVVIDHNEFSFINRDGDVTAHSIGDQTSVDFLKTASVSHPMLGETVTSPDAIARVSAACQYNPGTALVVYINAKGKVVELQEISEKIITNDKNFKNYLRNQMREAGAFAVAISTTSADIYNDYSKELIEEGYAVDVLYDDGNFNYDPYRSNYLVNIQKELWAGRSTDQAYTASEDNDIHYSITDKDSDGNQLSQGQREFFKDSKVTEPDGSLIVMYHGSVEDFNVFEKDKIKEVDTDAPFNGFWFSSDPNTSPAFRDAKYTKKVYLNITNPAPYSVWNRINKEIGYDFDQVREEARSINDEVRFRLQEMGYDGILFDGPYNFSQKNIDEYNETGSTTFTSARGREYDLRADEDDPEYSRVFPHGLYEELFPHGSAEEFFEEQQKGNPYRNEWVWVAFEPDQIKLTDNQDPTNNPDIRFSLRINDEYLDLNEDEIEELPPADKRILESLGRREETKREIISRTQNLYKSTRYTKGESIDPKSVERQIRELVMETMANSETKKKYKQKLVKLALDASKLIYKKAKQDDFEAVADIAYDTAFEIVENLDIVDDTLWNQYRELREYVRKTPIALTEEDKSEIPDYADWRKSNFGRIKVSDKGLPIDMFYQELSDQWPEMFSKEVTNPADQAMRVSEVLDELKPYEIAYSSEEADALTREIAGDLTNITFMGKEWQSYADKARERYNNKTKALKMRHKEAIRDLRTGYEKKMAAAQKKRDFETADRGLAEAMASGRENAKLKREGREATAQAKAMAKEKAADKDLAERMASGREMAAVKRKGEERISGIKAANKITIDNLRVSRDAQIRNLKQNYKRKEEAKKNARERAKSFGRIKANYDWLTTRLLKPTDDKHIPYGFEVALADVLRQLDLQTERSKSLEEKYGVKAKNTLKLEALRVQLEEISKEDGSGIFEYDGYVFDLLKALENRINGKSVDSLTDVELRYIDTLLKSIRHSIANINKAFAEGINENISQLADKTIAEAETRKARTEYGGAKGMIDQLLNESTVTPRDFFELMGGGLNDVYLDGLRAGMDRHIEHIAYLRGVFDEIFSPYNKKNRRGKNNQPGSEIEKWRDSTNLQEFTLESGQVVSMSPAQIMSLYCLMKRQQAVGHIRGNGITLTNISTVDQSGTKFKQLVNAAKSKFGQPLQKNGTAQRVSDADLQNIVSALTPEQMQMADRLQRIVSEDCSKWGNETSLQMYGYEKFTEANYFPIVSSRTYLASDYSKRETVESIKNFGFTKGTIVGANNPIVIDDIFTVVADHCNKMSLYNAFAAPIADFTRVMNYKVQGEDGLTAKALKAVIQDTYGSKAVTYINNFLADIQTQQQTRHDGMLSMLTKSLANYKKATIGANLRVALQQPTAVVRSFLLVDPKYFRPIKIKDEMQDMIKHCPIAAWKSWGHNQVDMARDIDAIMMNQEWTRLDAVTMEIYGALDNVTWAHIWAAVKNEVKAKNPSVSVGSEEFYELCNKRASEVFDKTQVVDSVFHRSQGMRSTEIAAKMMTSFMAEPTRTYNMMRTAYAQARAMAQAGDKKEAGKLAGKATTVFIANAMACGAAAAVADAIRDQFTGDDDDKDYENFFEAWYKSFIENSIENANPLGMIPFAKDIWQLRDWDSSNMAYEGWESLMHSIKTLEEAMTGKSKSTPEKAIWECVKSIGLIFGVPIKNGARELEGLANLFGITWRPLAAEKGIDLSSYDASADGEMRIKDGSWIDNLMNKFGAHLTSEEQMQKDVSGKAKEIQKKCEGTSGREYDKKLYNAAKNAFNDNVYEDGSKVTFASAIEHGDYKTIELMRQVLAEAGGDVSKFDEDVLKKTKSVFKANIGLEDNQAYMQMSAAKEYLIGQGWTRQDISSQLVAGTNGGTKCQTAKDFQVAFCENNQELTEQKLIDLCSAGLTFKDYVELVDNASRSVKAENYSTGSYDWPFDGQAQITKGYSRSNANVEIAMPVGTNVKAADGGKVTFVGDYGKYGQQVVIDHGNGRKSIYSHLDTFKVYKGQIVSKGDIIALSGNTGVTNGPSLGLKMYEGGSAIDPTAYL